MSNDTKTVLLSGVGGQGAILAADILSRVAMACGQDVKLSASSLKCEIWPLPK